MSGSCLPLAGEYAHLSLRCRHAGDMAGEPPPSNGAQEVSFLFTYHTGHADKSSERSPERDSVRKVIMLTGKPRPALSLGSILDLNTTLGQYLKLNYHSSPCTDSKLRPLGA